MYINICIYVYIHIYVYICIYAWVILEATSSGLSSRRQYVYVYYTDRDRHRDRDRDRQRHRGRREQAARHLLLHHTAYVSIRPHTSYRITQIQIPARLCASSSFLPHLTHPLFKRRQHLRQHRHLRCSFSAQRDQSACLHYFSICTLVPAAASVFVLLYYNQPVCTSFTLSLNHCAGALLRAAPRTCVRSIQG